MRETHEEMKSPAMPVRPAKDPNIETLRGLAILLVVAGHVIGIDATGDVYKRQMPS